MIRPSTDGPSDGLGVRRDDPRPTEEFHGRQVVGTSKGDDRHHGGAKDGPNQRAKKT